MWNALKSDLLDFVTTIQVDTAKTISNVLGDELVEVEEQDIVAKWVANIKRSYETYANPLRENRLKEYERFKKKFSLTAYTKQISEVLDEELEISRFYAELVPIQIPPEEFWARLFFRLHLLNRTGNVNFENDEQDEEEEQLVWEGEEEAEVDTGTDNTGCEDQSIAQGVIGDGNKVRVGVSNTMMEVGSDQSAVVGNNNNGIMMTKEQHMKQTQHIKSLEEENQRLKITMHALTNRVAQLELEVRQKTEALTALQHAQAKQGAVVTAPPQMVSLTTTKTVQPVVAMVVESSDDNEEVDDKENIASPTTPQDQVLPHQQQQNHNHHNHNNNLETASVSSSEGSGMMLNHSDVNSIYTDEETSRHGGDSRVLVMRSNNTAAANTNSSNNTAASGNLLHKVVKGIDSNSSSGGNNTKVEVNYAMRAKTAPYLAALDDEEEDGWT